MCETTIALFNVQRLPEILSSSSTVSGRIINFPWCPRVVLLHPCSKWTVTIFLGCLADYLSLGELQILDLVFVFIFSNGNLIDLVPSSLLFLVGPILSSSRISGFTISILNSSNSCFHNSFFGHKCSFLGCYIGALCVHPLEFGSGFASLSSRISTMSRFPL